jgi:hypothetical protein
VSWSHRGLAEAPLLSYPGHGDTGFSGQNDAGSTGFLLGAKRGRGRRHGG